MFVTHREIFSKHLHLTIIYCGEEGKAKQRNLLKGTVRELEKLFGLISKEK